MYELGRFMDEYRYYVFSVHARDLVGNLEVPSLRVGLKSDK